MSTKIINLAHRLISLIFLVVGSYNIFTLSKSTFVAICYFLVIPLLWNFIFDKYFSGKERNQAVSDFISGKLSFEELKLRCQEILEPVTHIRTCIYAIFWLLTEVISKCQI